MSAAKSASRPSRETVVPARAGTVQSVDRAFAVLKALSGKRDGATALELAAVTGIDRTTVHRLLRTLAGCGLVEVRGSAYLVGPSCLTLGAARLDGMNLRRATLPYAVELQNAIGQRPAVVSISARSKDEVVIVERMWTISTPLNIIIDIGMCFPMDSCASGRAILSTLPNEAVAKLMGAQRYRRIAPRLQQIRQRGGLEFGLSDLRAGVGAIACPLVNDAGTAMGAMVVAGLGLESDLTPVSPLAQHILRSCQSASMLLQSQP